MNASFQFTYTLSEMVGGKASSSEITHPAKTSSVRIKEYTGIELKTLWNHFNKDGVMTITELDALLERITTKDCVDMFTDLKRTKAWTKFCKSALKVLDTSQGSSVDLGEFTSEFNLFNSNRFYYAVKYLVPEILVLLKEYSLSMNVSEDRLNEFSISPPQDDLQTKLSPLQARISELEAELSKIRQSTASETGVLQKQLEDSRSATMKAEALVSQLERENANLKKSTVSDALIKEWQQKFDLIVQENGELRDCLERSRQEVVSQSTKIVSLKEQLDKNSGDGFSATAFGASINDIELDPFRTELLRQYGSFDSVLASFRVQSARKITMVEMETMCLSLGYTREYCRKLFYALDTRNRGYLTMEQFSRPLPILNKELCLLLKEEVKSSSPIKSRT